MNETYKKWDNYIGGLVYCSIAAQSKFEYFLLSELDSNDIYDLLYVKIALIARDLTKCWLYADPHEKLFKYLKFKLKAKKLQRLPHHDQQDISNFKVHVCDHEERMELLKSVAESSEISLDEIPKIYKEYYTK